MNDLYLPEQVETLFKCEPPIEKLIGAHGFMGVLLRDKNEDKLQCHECGKWFGALNLHVERKHKIACDSYRDKYGLPFKFPLVSRKISEAHSKNALSPKNLENLEKFRKPGEAWKHSPMSNKRRWRYIYKRAANDNMVGACPEQLLRRYLMVSDTVGRNPTYRDILAHDCSMAKLIKTRYGTLNKFRKRNGFEVTKANRPQNGYTDDYCLSALRSFHLKTGRVPKASDFRSGQDISQRTLIIKFGSWNRALLMAGFIKK